MLGCFNKTAWGLRQMSEFMKKLVEASRREPVKLDPESELRFKIDNILESASRAIRDSSEWWNCDDGPAMMAGIVNDIVDAARQYAEEVRHD